MEKVGMQGGDGDIPLLDGPYICVLVRICIYLLAYQPVVFPFPIKSLVNGVSMALAG